jgi:hypothetical protein
MENTLKTVVYGYGVVYTTYVEIHFVSSLAWDGFVQQKLTNFLSSLAWDVLDQHTLRFILLLAGIA